MSFLPLAASRLARSRKRQEERGSFQPAREPLQRRLPLPGSDRVADLLNHDAKMIAGSGCLEGFLRLGDGQFRAAIGTIAILVAADDEQGPPGKQAEHARTIELIED